MAIECAALQALSLRGHPIVRDGTTFFETLTWFVVRRGP
jgi:hypothetical protein